MEVLNLFTYFSLAVRYYPNYTTHIHVYKKVGKMQNIGRVHIHLVDFTTCLKRHSDLYYRYQYLHAYCFNKYTFL